MKICFFALQSLPIHARSLEERPLGGTETGLIRVAEGLTRRGHQVVVVTSHPAPMPFNSAGGPLYIGLQQLFQCGEFDAFVAVQFWRPLLENIPAKRKYFWTGDGYEQFSNLGIGDPRAYSRAVRVLCASNWHAQTLCTASGLPREKAVVVGNGIYKPFFSDEVRSRIPRNRRRLIYTSAPYRGLDLAAMLFQKLREQLPDLEFHVFSGLSIYDRDTAYQGMHSVRYEELKRKLAKIPGLVLHGNVKQQQLAEEYFKSALLIYPNTVEETFCITALEALAAGCPVIASANSALVETVGDGGAVISGEPGSEDYSNLFIEKAMTLLTDAALWEQVSSRARQRALTNYTWDHVTERIEGVLQ